MGTPEKETAAKVTSSPEVKKGLDDLMANVPGLAKQLNSKAFDYQTARQELLINCAKLYAQILLYAARTGQAQVYYNNFAKGEANAMAMMYEYGYVLAENEANQTEPVITEILQNNKLRLMTSMFYKEEFVAEVERQLSEYNMKIADDSLTLTPYDLDRTMTRSTSAAKELSYDTYYDYGASTTADYKAAQSLWTEPGSPSAWPKFKSILEGGGFLGGGGSVDSFGRYTSGTGKTYSNNKYVKYFFVGEPIRILDNRKSANFRNKIFEPKECSAGEPVGPCFGIFDEEELSILATGGF
jgi:hypothetical protein